MRNVPAWGDSLKPTNLIQNKFATIFATTIEYDVSDIAQKFRIIFSLFHRWLSWRTNSCDQSIKIFLFFLATRSTFSVSPRIRKIICTIAFWKRNIYIRPRISTTRELIKRTCANNRKNAIRYSDCAFHTFFENFKGIMPAIASIPIKKAGVIQWEYI